MKTLKIRTLTIAFAVLAFGIPSLASDYESDYLVYLTGPNEFISNTSPGTGKALIEFDTHFHQLSLQVMFFNLEGTLLRRMYTARRPFRAWVMPMS